ncbi:MAG: hypothetical protein MZV70_06890 [Desulfobacterales bacterium]|nr:hypothetical protein [Desulfobacterales bacterium]
MCTSARDAGSANPSTSRSWARWPPTRATSVKTCPALCGKAGLELLKADVAGGVNTLVLAACSPRVLYDTFRFDGCIVERVNLREHVVWSHPRSEFPAPTEEQKDDETFIDRVQMLASDYLKMALAKVQKINLPESYKLETLSKKILVIGGGTHRHLGRHRRRQGGLRGHDRREGGRTRRQRRQVAQAAADRAPLREAAWPRSSRPRSRSSAAYPGISVKTGTVVARIAGQPGDFTVTFKKPGEKIEFDVPFPLPQEMRVDASGKELEAEKLNERYKEYNQGKADILTFDPNGEKYGAVVLAAGWRPYQPKEGEFAHLGFGALPDVVTNAQFEEIAAAGKIKRPSDGQRGQVGRVRAEPGPGR